jgi:hypothetical protein
MDDTDGEKVADIRLEKKDFMGEPIEAIYSKVSRTYAVYGTPKRVMVQFADDDDLGAEQRRALSPLHPLRGEINGLLDVWRHDGGPRACDNQTRVRIFDRRTADALTVALQGDQAHARTLLEEVKADILEEQMSMGRVNYLLTATFCAVSVFLAFVLLSVADSRGAVHPTVGSFIALNKIWLAAGFGSLGALFSIALGIRSREVRPDLQRRDNILDAILRIMIGVVSAIVLFSLLRSQLVSLGFGGDRIDFAVGNGTAVHLAIIVAFVAGFSERLVGNYLTRATLDDRRASASAASAQQHATRETESNERNPLGRKELNQDRAEPRRRAAAVAKPPANDPGQPNDARVAARRLNGRRHRRADIPAEQPTG